jgi:hypothetical protein
MILFRGSEVRGKLVLAPAAHVTPLGAFVLTSNVAIAIEGNSPKSAHRSLRRAFALSALMVYRPAKSLLHL